MNTALYLKRIGMSENLKFSHSVEFLNQLQLAHVTRVPYENLDIIKGVPLNLDPEHLFDKIVIRNRGGYCFDVNGLFGALLTELGFRVTHLAARFLRNESTIPLRRHRVLLVECDEGEYICDVGIGSAAPRYPLKLQEGIEQHQFGETYKLQREDFLGWVIYEKHGEEWRRFYSFTLEPQIDVDFITPSFYCEKHPDSIFNKDVMVAIKTETGRKTLNGREYKVFSGEDITEIREKLSDEGIKEVLEKEFFIKL